MGLPYTTGTVVPSLDPANVSVPGEGGALFGDSTNGGMLCYKRPDGLVSEMPWASKVGAASDAGGVPVTVTLFTLRATAKCVMIRVSAMWRGTSPAVFGGMTFGGTCSSGVNVDWLTDGSAAVSEGASVGVSESAGVVSLVLTGDGGAGSWLYGVDFVYV